MWKSVLERGRPRRQYGACALHAGYLRLQIHSGCVILITFPLQKMLQERASMLRSSTLPVLLKYVSFVAGSDDKVDYILWK
jgi:hypothetical protein